MTKNLLEIVKDATDTIGLPRPSTVIGSVDPQVRKLLAAAQREGRELARRHAWQALKVGTTFTSVAQASQTSAVPADFDRMVNDTFWNRTQTREVQGPLTEQEYAEVVARGTTYFNQAYLIRGGAILITPTPTAGETMAYTYVTKFWAGTAASTSPTLSGFASDSDIPYLDDEAFTLGVIWRFKTSGLEYGEDFAAYERLVAQLIGRDGGKRILDMNPSRRRRGAGDVTVTP